MKKSKKELVEKSVTEASSEAQTTQTETTNPVEVAPSKVAIKDRLKNSALKVKTSFKGKKDLVAANYSNLWIKYRGRSKRFKILTALASVLVTIILLLILNNYVLKLDRNLFETNLVGYVREQDGLPIEGVQVCLKSNCTTTNTNGQFEFKKLVYGFNKFSLRKEDYKTLKRIVIFQEVIILKTMY
jgi:hypothetical protein